jgi:hypothetical protein
MTDPVISLAQYRVKAGAEAEFEELLRQHQSTLRSLELITDRPVQTFLGDEKEAEGPYFVEIFEWAGESSINTAHTHPRISAHWEAMGALCEERGGHPMFEFKSLKTLDLG